MANRSHSPVLDSDWTVKNDTPHYGLKEHASVDTNNGFILATKMTPASYNDSPYLHYCTTFSLHADQMLETIYADKGTSANPIGTLWP